MDTPEKLNAAMEYIEQHLCEELDLAGAARRACVTADSLERFFSYMTGMSLCNRKISTYINALAKAGFCLEEMIEQTDEAVMRAEKGVRDKIDKAQMLPLSMLFRARKL